MKVSLISLILLFIISIPLFAQKTPYNPQKQYSPTELKEDLATMRRHFETVQAGLYTYTSKAKLDQQFEAIEEQLDKPMRDIEFYRLLAPILEPIGNGHTNIGPSDGFLNHHRTQLKLFPVSVKWLNSTLYIFLDLSTPFEMPIGSKILAINGQKADSLFVEMRKSFTRDGYNLTGPNRRLAGRFRHHYSYQFGNPDTFVLTVENAEGEVQEVKLAAEAYETILDNYRERYQEKLEDDDPLLSIKIEDKVATMTIQTFSTGYAKNQGQKFKPFLDDAFLQINQAGVEHLIIDMRGNGGGDPEPTIQLFAYLHDKPFTFYKEISTITRNIPDNRMYKDKIFLQELFFPLRTKRDRDIFQVKGISGTKESQPLQPHYAGKVYALIDGNSFSATGEMTAILKEHDRVIFIGEEAGGNPVRNTSGIMLRLVLPHTKVNVINPAILWKMNVSFENTGHGVVPDHAVEPSIEELIEGKDVVMAFTKELIKKE